MAESVRSEPSTGRILVTGSLAFDHIMVFPGYFKDHILPDKLHLINLSFLVDSLKKQRGGCAANIAYSLALLGERPRILAAAGSDFGDYKQWLAEQGVEVGHILEVAEEITASCFITTDKADNQITGFYVGAMARARELSLKGAADGAAWAIVAPDDPEAMVRHCREAREAGMPLVFDPSFQVIAMDGEALAEAARGARFVILNDYEFAVFQEKTGASAADLLELADHWVVTLGEKGSEILRRGRDPLAIPAARPRAVVDPTGAGDAYRSGFLAGLARGRELAVCGRMGSVAAAYAIEQYGTQNHRYTAEEFARRYAENFG